MSDYFSYNAHTAKKWLGSSISYAKKKYIYGSMSDEAFDCMIYNNLTGNKLETTHPETFTEKLLYLKRNLRDPLLQKCADKFLVRGYLEEKGYGSLLNRLYGVFDSPKEISFDSLPERFFIKCSSYSGANFYVNQKKSTGLNHLLRYVDSLRRRDYFWIAREWPYKGVRSKVLCEQALVSDDGAMPLDYKFYCFGGELKYYMVSYGEYSHRVRNHKLSPDNVSIDYLFKPSPTIPFDEIVLPENIETMKKIATDLSKPFRHVRVDLYNFKGKIYFGELTFYSSGGFVNIPYRETELLIGSYLDISGV